MHVGCVDPRSFDQILAIGISVALFALEDKMQSSTTHSNRGLSELAERQMRNWALDLQTQRRFAEQTEALEPRDLIHPYLAISREAGADAGGLARAVGARCGWKVLDDELLDYIAEHEHLSRLALEFVDERAVSWFHEMFGKWLEKQLVSQAEYVSRLGKIMLLAAQHESTVIVGRGARFILPRELGFAVRIIAPLKQRIKSIIDRRQCSEREAKTFVETTDRDREHFIQRYFHHDVTDPHLYDLVINLANIPRDDAVEMIASEVKRHEQRALTAGGPLIRQTMGASRK
jgi:cytidylate kinase